MTPTGSATVRNHSLLSSVRLLLTRRFGSFWVGSLLSNLGTWMQQVAEPWLILSMSGSSFLLGLDAFAMDAPVWILTLLGGVLADRRDRSKVIAFFQTIQMLCPILLVLLILTRTIHVWMIIGLSLIVGITDALSMPAFQSIVPSIVAPNQIGTAIALNSTQFNLSRVLGPAIAGVVMARYGPVWCFGANALSYIPLLLTVYWIRVTRKADRRFAMSSGRPWFAEIRRIGRQPRLLGALCTVLVTSMFCGPLIAFSPVLIKHVFHSDASHFGQAIAAFGAGGLIGATGILAVEGRVDRIKLCSGAAVLYGALLTLVAVNRSLPLLSVLLVLCGAAMTASNTSANSILQYTAHDRIRGRTSSLYMLAMRGGLSLGNLVAAVSVTYLGVSHVFLINGIAAVLIHAWIYRKWVCATAAVVQQIPSSSEHTLVLGHEAGPQTAIALPAQKNVSKI
ncbi:MFS transporter [Candidatus Binatus sp.]|uniref:MFS transporter n=1 Tax=Candidatus Binatus sp. TaxID=2811406 RepID=UPI003C4C2EE6